jgi:hypothetical protein
LEEQVAAPVHKSENKSVGIRRADYAIPFYPQKLALTSPTSGGRSVGIVRSRTQPTEFFLYIAAETDSASNWRILWEEGENKLFVCF